jgi:hypothetical protein
LLLSLGLLGSLALNTPHAQVASSNSKLGDQRASAASAGSQLDHLSDELTFVPNAGQWATDARFVARHKNVVVRAAPDGLWLELNVRTVDPDVLRRQVVKFEFVGANPSPEIRGLGSLPSKLNFFVGSDPTRWRSELSTFEGIRYADLWPGVALVVRRGGPEELLHYDLEFEPGAQMEPVRIRVLGAESIDLQNDGRLTVGTALGEVTHSAPLSFVTEPSELVTTGATGISSLPPQRGTRVLASSIRRTSPDSYGFEVPEWNGRERLTVDPGLVWASFVGGSIDDIAYGVTVDPQNRLIVTGRTFSSDFPAQPGAIDASLDGFADSFVARFDPTGSKLEFGTYFGGSASDVALTTVVDPLGAIFVSGSTHSVDLPTTPTSYDTTLGGVQDIYLAKFSKDGNNLRFCTYLGGSAAENFGEVLARNIAPAPDGDVYMVGYTFSPDFPVVGPGLFPTPNYSFVARVKGTGESLVWSTYFGGSGYDVPYDIASDAVGHAIITGESRSDDLPMTAWSYDPVHQYLPPDMGAAAFITSFEPDGQALAGSTYFHASGYTLGQSVAVDSSGRIAILGGSSAPDLPITPGAMGTATLLAAGCVAVFDSQLSNLISSSYIVSPAATAGDFFKPTAHPSIFLDDSGIVTVMGSALGYGFPVTPGGTAQAPNLQLQLYFARIAPGLKKVLYGSYFGSLATGEVIFGGDQAQDWRVAFAGAACCSDSFPATPGAFDTTFGGFGPSGFAYGDGIAGTYELEPPGATSLGVPGQGCNGAVRLIALASPKASGSTFAIACTGAPASSIGACIVGSGFLPGGIPLLGGLLQVDIGSPYLLAPALADSLGYAERSLPIPATAVGLTLYVQAGWLDTGGCGGTFTLSTSDVLRLDVMAP